MSSNNHTPKKGFTIFISVSEYQISDFINFDRYGKNFINTS